MKANMKIVGLQLAKRELQRELDKLHTGKIATVGIHEDAGTHEGGITMAQLGSLLDNGNPDNKYYGNPAPIPARHWLVPGVRSATKDVTTVIRDGIKNGDDAEKILEAAGIIAAGATQVYMTELQTPPNSPVTIAEKGSSNPLIDTGALRSSITSKVE